MQMRQLTHMNLSAGTVTVMKKTLEEMTLTELLDSLPLPPLDPNDPDPWMRRAALWSSTTAPGATSQPATSDTPIAKTSDCAGGASTEPQTTGST